MLNKMPGQATGKMSGQAVTDMSGNAANNMPGKTARKLGRTGVYADYPDLSGLNEAQRRAVTYGEGPLLLLAGPGSGKTLTITNRILFLLQNGAAPEELLVITFTKEAALSMQRRFQEMCGSTVYPVNFGTFHSCFYHILQKSGAVGARKIINNSEKVNLLLPILKRYLNYDGAAKHNAIKQSNESLQNNTNLQHDMALQRDVAAQILSAVSFYKNTLKYEEALKKLPTIWQSYFDDIITAYEERVKEERLIDFDDMLSGCRRLLQENMEVRNYWQERFSYILIDEFQDINPVQYQVVKLLVKAPYNIFAVGDDDQAIYGFRGAEPDCLRRFEKEFGAERMLLNVNYRSGREIVQTSLAVIGENKNRFEKKLYAAQADMLSQGVVCRGFMGREEQYRYMSDTLSHGSAGQESCAVLFRTNSYMQGFAARLSKEGIPYEIKEKAVSIYEHFIVRDVMAYLSVADGSACREDFLRIVNKPSRYVSREAVAECGTDFAGLKSYYERQSSLSQERRMKVIDGLTSLERQLKNISRLPLHLGVNFCLKAAGYERYLKEKAVEEDKWQEWQELLEWLREDAAQYPCLKEWLAAQKVYNKALSQGAASGKRIVGERDKRKPIQLMTVHAAKGLEFDKVWIPDCNEKVYPHGSFPDMDSVEEERRIFYVAMTRAKRSLELLYLTGTREHPRQPSRFLNPLLKCTGPHMEL